MRSIGRYVPKRKIGSGSQGVVYLCEDPKLKREVAVKLLNGSFFGDRSNVAFEQEAQALGRFQHQNIVSVYDFGLVNDRPFIVFEYVKGQLLSRWITEQPRRLPQKLKMMSGILKGVAVAHQSEVIHRDLKPENIIIDAEGIPKIMDFGISVLFHEDSKSDEVVGTAGFMPAEYLQRHEVSTAVDVFALGAVCYEILTGSAPFTGKTSQEIHKKVLDGYVEPPSELSSTVSQALDTFCLKALAKNPDDRYADATEMLLDLQIIINESSDDGGIDSHGKATLEFIYRRMQRKPDFPALANSIRSINELQATSEKDAEKLAAVIVNDFALTNKILKVVNSAYYGGFSGKINTISRAIVVLGVDSVRSIAASLIFYEHMSNHAVARKLKKLMASSLFRALFGEQLARYSGSQGVEEVFLCAMFYELGEALVTYYLPEEDQEIERQLKRGQSTRGEVIHQVLGVSYEEIGAYVAREWNFPDMIIDVIRTPEPRQPGRPVTLEDRYRLLTHIAERAVVALLEGEEDARLHQLLEPYQHALGFDQEKLEQALQGARGQFLRMATSLFNDQQVAEHVERLQGNCSADLNNQSSTSVSVELEEVLRDESLKPLDAEAILTQGLQEVSQIMLETGSISQVFNTVLESLYRALGFRRIFLSLQKANVFKARLGFGEEIKATLVEFSYVLDNSKNVFSLSLKKGADVYIANVHDSKIRQDLPNWYGRFTNASSFVLFPLMLNNRPIGFIYGEYAQPEQLKLEAKVFNLIKSLRNQMIIALKQH